MEGSGELLVASWALFGRILDALERLLGTSWASWVHLGPSRLDLGSILGPQGSIWGRFWKGLGRIWEGLGRILANFWMDLERYGEESG